MHTCFGVAVRSWTARERRARTRRRERTLGLLLLALLLLLLRLLVEIKRPATWTVKIQYISNNVQYTREVLPT